MVNDTMQFMVKDTIRKGFGLYSEKNYSEGDLVFDESAYIIFKSKISASANTMRLYGDIYIDSHHTLVSDFINHSCNPNLEYDLKEFKFYAIKSIDMGDELTYDYESTEVALDREKLDFSCHCESTKCRKIISGKKE